MSTTAFIVDDSFDELLENAARSAATAVDAVGAAVLIFDDLLQHLLAHVGVDPGLEISRAVARELGCARLVFDSGEAVTIVDTLTDGRVRPEIGELLGIRAFAGVPLFVDGTIVGVLGLFDRRPRVLDLAALPAGLTIAIEQRLKARRRDVDAHVGVLVAQRPALRLVQAMQAGAVSFEVFMRALRLLPPVTVPEL